MTTFLTVLLGSGLGAAIVTAFFDLWSSYRQSEIDRLQQQLASLYGPLYYFTSQNHALFDLYRKYHDAYGKQPGIHEYAPEAQEKARAQAKTLLNAANSYMDEVVKNNQQVIEILRSGWHVIDPDDVEVFSQFQIDYTRSLKFEKEDPSVASIVHEHIGDISYMRPQMIEVVRRKWDEKRRRMVKLSSFPRRRWPKTTA